MWLRAIILRCPSLPSGRPVEPLLGVVALLVLFGNLRLKCLVLSHIWHVFPNAGRVWRVGWGNRTKEADVRLWRLSYFISVYGVTPVVCCIHHSHHKSPDIPFFTWTDMLDQLSCLFHLPSVCQVDFLWVGGGLYWDWADYICGRVSKCWAYTYIRRVNVLN